jgi:hypothetical protein
MAADLFPLNHRSAWTKRASILIFFIEKSLLLGEWFLMIADRRGDSRDSSEWLELLSFTKMPSHYGRGRLLLKNLIQAGTIQPLV